MSKTTVPYIACGCCGNGLAANFLKAIDPIWERCPECIKIHGPDVHLLSAPVRPNVKITGAGEPSQSPTNETDAGSGASTR